MKGILYGVGVGPGDPDLITLKAIKTLKSADLIAVPDTGGKNTALEIIDGYIDGKEILLCPMPMTKDKDILEAAHRQSGELIKEALDKGKNVAFITLGDPTVYSTYMYIHSKIKDKGYKVEIISGVTSFCAAAATLGISLCDGDETLHILPATYENYRDIIKQSGTKVLMKSGKSIDKVKSAIKESGLENSFYIVEKCGMADERIYTDIDKVGDDLSYFSVIILKDNQ